MGQTDDQNQDQPGAKPPDSPLVSDAEAEEQEESALWSELDDAEQAAAGEPSPGEPGDDDAAAAAAASSDADGSAAGAGQQPGKAAGDPPVVDRSGEASPDPGTTDQDDPWAKAPPELKAAHEAAERKWESRDKRLRGQVSALNRKVQELSTARAQPPAGSGAGSNGTGRGDPTDPVESFFASDKWKTHEQEYPEVAGPTKDLIGVLVQELREVKQGQVTIQGRQQEQELEAQYELLESEHSDWEDVVAADEFLPWLEDQPRHIREAAVRNAEGIVDAEEAADVIGRFKAFRSAQGEGHRPSNSDTPAAGNGAGNGNPRLSGKRQRQLESAAGARSRTPGPATGIPRDGDEESIWKAMDEQERRMARA